MRFSLLNSSVSAKKKFSRIFTRTILTFIFVFSLLLVVVSPFSEKISALPFLDGKISPNEYDAFVSFGNDDFELYWSISGTEINIGMIGQTTGWVSLGFSPTVFMKDADMIFGWVYSNGSLNITDAYSIDNFGPHPPDVLLGGSDDILESSGQESPAGLTTLEVRRLLTTGDFYDKPIPSTGIIEIIWAIGNEDTLSGGHIARGKGTINMDQGTSEETTLPSLWIYHVVLLSLGFLSLSAGVIINRFFKRKKWRIKVHKQIGYWGSLASATGLIISLVMVKDHLSVIHHFFGVIALPFVIITPILGVLFSSNLKKYPMVRKMNPYRKQIRIVHRWLGYITILMMLASIISGLIRAFG